MTNSLNTERYEETKKWFTNHSGILVAVGWC